MAEIHKLKKNNKTILPVTTTEAVVDPGSNKTLNDVLKSFEAKEQKNKVNGYPGLDANGKILKSQLPDNFQPTSEKGRANGYPALDNSGTIPDAQIPSTVERVKNKNKANGYAGLDADGMLDNRQVRKAFGYRLDTIDDQILIPKTALTTFGANDFTIETVIKLNTKTIVFSYVLWNITYGPRFGIYIERSNISFSLTDGTNAYTASALIDNKVNVDYHIICTIKNGIPYIYINGQLMGIGKDATGVSFDSIDSSIKINGSVGQKINGNISLLRAYKRGFTQSDVDYYYNMGRPDLSRLSYSDKINKTTTGCVLELLPENSTASKWLDTQNGLDGVTSGNPIVNYGNVTPEPYIEPFKKYIGLEQTGNGTGVSSFLVKTNGSGKLNITGGIFTNNDGSVSLGNELSIFKDIETIIYVKLESSVGEISCDNMVLFEMRSALVNAPIIRVNTSDVPLSFSTSGQRSFIRGSLFNLPRDMNSLVISVNNNTDYTDGKYFELPRSLTYFRAYTGNKINGDIKYLPNVSTLLLYDTTNDTFGDLANLPSTLQIFETTGTGALTGDLGLLKGTFRLLGILTASNFTYSTGIKVQASFDRLQLRPAVGSFTSAMTDQLLIDLAAQITSFTASKIIDLTGNCGAPTAASSTARATLSGLGATVLTN